MSKTPKTVRPATIRRCITTLTNAGFIKPENSVAISGIVYINMEIPGELIQPKKKLKK